MTARAMIYLDYEGVDVGVEINPNDRNPSMNGGASVRFYVKGENGERVYISDEDARLINDIDRTAWLRRIRDALHRDGDPDR